MINGTRYAVGYIVYYDDDESPVFAKICDIVILPNTTTSIFILSLFITQRFNEHYHAYEVSPTTNTVICHQNDLADYHPLSISRSYILTSPMFVRVKYNVM